MPCSTRITIRPLSMSATLIPAASDARSPAAYAVVSAARAFRPGTALRKATTSSALSTTGSLRGVRAYGIRSGRSACLSVTPYRNRSAQTVWFSAGHEIPPATTWTWKARTSSRPSLSGERPKKRPNLATACTYDRCVAGDRLRTVMSSIMRRRSGLISVIGGLPSRVGVKHPNLADQPTSLPRERRLGYRVSGLVQSVRPTVSAETKCYEFLKGEMQKSPDRGPRKSDVLLEAQAKFPG